MKNENSVSSDATSFLSFGEFFKKIHGRKKTTFLYALIFFPSLLLFLEAKSDFNSIYGSKTSFSLTKLLDIYSSKNSFAELYSVPYVNLQNSLIPLQVDSSKNTKLDNDLRNLRQINQWIASLVKDSEQNSKNVDLDFMSRDLFYVAQLRAEEMEGVNLNILEINTILADVHEQYQSLLIESQRATSILAAAASNRNNTGTNLAELLKTPYKSASLFEYYANHYKQNVLYDNYKSMLKTMKKHNISIFYSNLKYLGEKNFDPILKGVFDVFNNAKTVFQSNEVEKPSDKNTLVKRLETPILAKLRTFEEGYLKYLNSAFKKDFLEFLGIPSKSYLIRNYSISNVLNTDKFPTFIAVEKRGFAVTAIIRRVFICIILSIFIAIVVTYFQIGITEIKIADPALDRKSW